jgi:hypothetical protein
MCESCQRAKGLNTKPFGKLHLLTIPLKPWDSIGMDFIGPFLESKDCNYLWVIICHMTSMVHLIPVHTRMKASKLSWIYQQEIIQLHGLKVHIEMVVRTAQDPRDQTTDVHVIPPSNRWPDGMC